MTPDISLNEHLLQMSNGISKRKDWTLKSIRPHRNTWVCTERRWRTVRGHFDDAHWLDNLTLITIKPPHGSNLSKVTKLEGGEAKVQTRVHWTQNPMHNLLHYVYGFSTDPLCLLYRFACLPAWGQRIWNHQYQDHNNRKHWRVGQSRTLVESKGSRPKLPGFQPQLCHLPAVLVFWLSILYNKPP